MIIALDISTNRPTAT